MKSIIINDYNKFVDTEKFQLVVSKKLKFEHLYKNGYWNIMKWSESLIEFLESNNIDYDIEADKEEFV
jgi:hypothetical protein